MGFSITSAVLGGIIIICYSISIAIYRDDYHYSYRKHRFYNAEMALSAIILILGIVEFAIGIWASVCICLMNPCGPPPQRVSSLPRAIIHFFFINGRGRATTLLVTFETFSKMSFTLRCQAFSIYSFTPFRYFRVITVCVRFLM